MPRRGEGDEGPEGEGDEEAGEDGDGEGEVRGLFDWIIRHFSRVFSEAGSGGRGCRLYEQYTTGY